MNYKVVKYKKKRKVPFETYEPRHRININKENTMPWIVRVGNRLACLGGLLSFFVASFLMVFRGIFKVEEKVRKFSFNNKIVEIRVRKR